MSQIKLQIYYKNVDGKTFRRVLSYVNPDVSNDVLMSFVNKLNSLTTNEIVEVFKIVNRLLEDQAIYDDNSFVNADEISAILAGNYKNIFDEDFISEEDFLLIIGGNFSNTPDDEFLTESDFIFWEEL